MSNKIDQASGEYNYYLNNSNAIPGQKPQIPNAILKFGSESAQQSPKAETPPHKYNLGRRRGNIRYITPDAIMDNSPTLSVSLGNRQLALPASSVTPTRYANTTDNYIDDSAQAKRGDCYFLAEINAIRNTKDGQKILTQNLKKNSDGSYTVTLPGAVKMMKQYEQKGLPCEITGTYHISKTALLKAGNSQSYSKGDLETVAFEIAMEAYRAELYLTNKANQNNDTTWSTAEGGINPSKIRETGDFLSSGTMWDAGFILTGKKSEVAKQKQTTKLYSAGQYGYISREEMARRSNADISMYKNRGIETSEISRLSQGKQAINSMLIQYEGKEKDYALTFSAKVAKNGPDGKTIAGSNHALTILKITPDTIYVANPWYPNKIEPIPREDFIKMAGSIQAMPVKIDKPTTQNNTSTQQALLNQIQNLIKY